jgi:hypothetical protein
MRKGEESIMLKKRLLATTLAVAMLLPNTACAAETTLSFSDIPKNYWAYESIMSMTEQGLFSGTSDVVNGVGTFSPDDQMTVAEFITVVTRALYAEELNGMSTGNIWYQNNYVVALKHKIVTNTEYDGTESVMSQPIPRQEMAMIMVRAVNELGEAPSKLVSTNRIADWSSVGSYYKDYVRQAYSMGLLGGKDSKGTFDPKGVMTRAEGAAVLNRILDSSSRVEVDFSNSNKDESTSVQTINVTAKSGGSSRPWTIYVGPTSERRNVKEGDIIVRPDGTKVTVKKNSDGVLVGQGAADYGMKNKVTGSIQMRSMWANGSDTNYTDCLGNSLSAQTYHVLRGTGDGYWYKEIELLKSKYPMPSYDGKKDGETSTDAYKLWVWDSAFESWSLNQI